MAASNLEMVKDIPGYKVILKAVLKGQIQQLVEQLAVHTDEESIILTASVADGTLSHLGSQFGKGFLDHHEDIKSQFLGFCLKNHHRLQSQTGNQGDTQASVSQMLSTGPGQGQGQISPKLVSPKRQPLSPVTSTRSSHKARHEPYPVSRNSGRRGLSFVPSTGPTKTKTLSSDVDSESIAQAQVFMGDDNIEIKVECLENIEESNSTREVIEILNQSVSEVSEKKLGFKNEATFQNEAKEVVRDINATLEPENDNSSKSIPNFPDGLILKTGNFTDHSGSGLHGTRIELDQSGDNTVKVEAISESEMELEITGLTQATQNIDHSKDTATTPDPRSGASGSEGEGASQQSRIGKILMMGLTNPEKLPKYQCGESWQNLESKRFASHSRDDVRKKISGVRKLIGPSKDKSSWTYAVKQMGKSSQRSNKQAADIFRQFLIEKDEDVNFEVMSKSELAKLLSDFYINARTKDGELYKLKSITHIRCSLNRYLKSPPCSRKLDILHDEEFIDANKAFTAAVEEIKASGKGDISHYPIITDSDLILLYSSNFLSPDTPSGLQNRVQMTIRLTFSREISENMEKMTKDTFKFATNPDGTVYVYKQVNSDASSSSESIDESFAQLKEDRGNPYLCPVRAFKIYLSKLHPVCARLWQYPVDVCMDTETVWYHNKPVGKNVLGKFMSNLSKAVPLSKVYTNHSIRITGNSIINGERRSLKEVMTLAAVKKEN